jgi:hypothetical protein
MILKQKEFIENTMCVLISLQVFPKTFLIPRRTRGDMIKKFVGLHDN